MSKKFLVVSALLVVMLVPGCGGGGGSTTSTTPSTTTVTSTLSFPLQSAFRAFFASGYGTAKSFTVSGSCIESGTDSVTAATTSTTFEGTPALSATHTRNYTTSNCVSAPSSYSETIYLNSNYDELGSSGTGYYGVFQTTPAYPASVVVGSSGSYGTAFYYSDSTKTTSTGHAVYTYIVEPDTSTTVVVNRIKKFYSISGSLISTHQMRFRVTSAGALTPISTDYIYGSTHLMTTYGGGNGGGASTSTAGTWVATNNPISHRSHHTATLLSNGLVLVAGGLGSNGKLTELYNPATGEWAPTGNLTFARSDHTATLLPNGKVLVAGGSGINGKLVSSELYDPTTGTWSTTGNLAAARTEHTATLLANGQVLVIGGDGATWDINGTGITTNEIYNPATGAWSSIGGTVIDRSGHTATLLPNGKVLVTGGWGTVGYIFTDLASAELFNPATGTWVAAGSLTTARGAHSATLLPNGTVLVSGGGGTVGTGYARYITSELYDIATGVWTTTGSMAAERGHHTATLLQNGKVLVSGGEISLLFSLATAEIYDPTTGKWTTTGGLTSGRAYHTATLLPDGKVLVTGGEWNPLAITAELYWP